MDISVVFAWMMQYGISTEYFYKFVGERQNYVQRQLIRFFLYLYLQYSKLKIKIKFKTKNKKKNKQTKNNSALIKFSYTL